MLLTTLLAEHPEAFTSSAAEEADRPADALARRLAADPARPHDAVFGAFDGAALVGLCGVDVDMREIGRASCRERVY